MITDKGRHRLSFTLSVVIHLVLLLIPSFQKQEVIEKQAASPPTIPVEFTVKEVIIQPPKKVVPTKTIPKPVKKPKPKRLPGDRSRAIVSDTAEPYYPKEAINYGYEGTVTVLATVNSKGSVIRVKLLKSSGHDLLDQGFMNTVKKSYRFKPKRVMGVNKTDKIKLSYTFEL